MASFAENPICPIIVFDLNQTKILFALLTAQTSLKFVFVKYGRDLVLLFHEIKKNLDWA